MKKIKLQVVLAVLLVILLTACTGKSDSPSKSDSSASSSSQEVSSKESESSKEAENMQNASSQSSSDGEAEDDETTSLLELSCFDDHPGIPGFDSNYTMRAYYKGRLVNSGEFTLTSNVDGVIIDGNKVTVPTSVKENVSIVMITATYKKDNTQTDKYPLKVKQWSQTFDDEFEGSSIDYTKWAVRLPTTNNKPTRHCSNPDMPYVENGKLMLKCEKREYTFNYNDKDMTADYSESWLHTKDIFTQKYGCFMASIKLPQKGGANTAFWMLPNEGDWSKSYLFKSRDNDHWCGEIDILEKAFVWGDKFQNTLHYWDSTGNRAGIGGAERYEMPGILEGFHNYACVWTENALYFYFDGNLFRTVKGIKATGQEAYMIIDCELGQREDYNTTSWIGTFKDEDLPITSEVDYVRAYK